MDKAKYQIFNSLALKIIAIITMTFDHIGRFLMSYGGHNTYEEIFWKTPMSVTGYVFACIGRFALPLICILVVEAMRHSKHKEQYLFRLAIMAIIVLIGNVIANKAFGVLYYDNIFILLLCGASSIYLLERNDKFTYLLVIPIFFVLMGGIAMYMSNYGITINWWPVFLSPQYNIYGYLLILGLYYAYKLADLRLASLKEEHNLAKSVDELKEYGYYRTLVNWIWIAIIVVINIFYWLLARGDTRRDIYYMPVQSWAILAVIPVFLYNGNKGYKSQITKYAFYVYYPLHLVIIFVAFRLAFGY